MKKENDSILLRVSETCLSDNAAVTGCNYCKKIGMPILIARYAVRGNESSLFNPTMKADDRVADAMPWDLRPDRTINIQHDRSQQNQTSENEESITLPSFAEYILRRPRQGYLYVYDEINGGEWKGYYIDPKGYIKSDILSNPTSLSSGEGFSCNSNPENVAFGSVITLPFPEISRKVYLAYVESAWSYEWRNKIAKDEKWRKSHMQSFIMSSNCSGSDIYPIEQLEELIFEYSNDTLMVQMDNNNLLFSEILGLFGSIQSIARYTKETIINHAKKHHYPTPFILALHDDIGITLHLNELRVAQQLMLQDKMKDPEIKRRHLCVTSLMSLESSIRSSPYAAVKYDGVPRAKSLGKKMWELVSADDLTEKKPITDDFHVEGIADGCTYKYWLQKEAMEKALDKERLHEDPFSYGHYDAQDREFLIPTGGQKLREAWDAQAAAQEQIAKEFYQSKYFDYNQYYYDKIKIINESENVKNVSFRLDIDYCWWLKNKLFLALECYDNDDLCHRSVATSLLSRALIGGIISQASRDLWKQFHDAPEEKNNTTIIKGILGWNDELAKKLQEFLATDTAGSVDNKKKPKTIFEEFYIKEIGKLVKKLNSLYKDKNKIIDKDFSQKALNAFKTMHESAQEIADTLESTHHAIITSEQYIATNGLTEEIRSRANNKAIKYSQYEFHSSGLRVTQFKTLRIMHAHRMACMDIVAHVKSLEAINNKVLSRTAIIESLETKYALLSRQMFAINNMERHIVFIERPIVDFFDDITRLKAQKVSDQLKNIKNNPITVYDKNSDPGSTKIDEKTIKYNNPDIDLYSNSLMEQAIIYCDNNAFVIENNAKNISAIEDNITPSSSAAEQLDKEIALKKYNQILRAEYTKSINGDFRNRWVGRLSRLAVYWGFIESFEKLSKNPTDIQAWWKMSSSVVFVVQSYFDVWEQAAKTRLAYLDAAQKAEITIQGTAPEYLITGSKVAGAEAQFAKLWSKRIGVLGSTISIIDGLRELAHAQDMSQHGELRRDVLLTEVKGWMSIASGFIGIILIDTVFLGGALAIFAFAIALWLLPSTDTLIPLGVRNWLRRSLFKLPDDHARYFPFANWEEEQAAFKTMLKGIEISTKIVKGYDGYRLTVTMDTPLEISTNFKYLLEVKVDNFFYKTFEWKIEKEKYYFIDIVDYSYEGVSIESDINELKNLDVNEKNHNIEKDVEFDIKSMVYKHQPKIVRILIMQLNEEVIDSYIFDVES